MIKRILVIFLTLLIISTMAISVSARVPLNDFSIGISANDTYFNNVRQLERLNQMQVYVYPTYNYDSLEGTPTFDPRTAYLPVNIPRYIINRTQTAEYVSLDHIMELYSFVGNGSSANSATVFFPFSYEWVNGDYQLSYTILNNTTDNAPMANYWHGTVYSKYQSSNVITRELNGLTIISSDETVLSNTIRLNGRLNYITKHGTQYRYFSEEINKYYFLAAEEELSINCDLIPNFPYDQYDEIWCAYVGEIIVSYGTNEFEPIIYREDLGLEYSNLVSYSPSGLEASTYISFSEEYADKLSYALSGGDDSVVSGTINIIENGIYNVSEYAYANVNVPQTVSWSGMFDWLFDSIGSFMDFEIAPDWTIGIIMTIIIGLAIAIWVLKVFLGG